MKIHMLIENFTVNLGKFWGNLDGVNLGKFGGNFGHDLGKLYWLELATLVRGSSTQHLGSQRRERATITTVET